MTVKDDVDICLNITQGQDFENIKKQKTSKFNEDVRIKRLKNNSNNKIKKVFQKFESTESSKESIPVAQKRFKQKSLASIVANNLKKAKEVPKSSILKKTTPGSLKNSQKSSKPSGALNKKAEVSKNEKKKVNFVDKKDSDKVENKTNFSNSKVDSESSETFVSFTKPTKENAIKTILAKKRKNDEDKPKKSLSSIFNASESTSEKNILKNDSDSDKISNKFSVRKQKIESSENSHKTNDDTFSDKESHHPTKKFKKSKDKIEKNKNHKNDSKEVNYRPHSGKISSLFGHNPTVPNIGQRFVKPINEKVFAAEKFSELGIHPFAVSNLEQNMSITTMTTVQKKAIPVILSGSDVLIRSQTGSGKTLAYALPIIESLQSVRPKLTRDSGTKALVIVPTRELALQTYECFRKLIKPFTWIVPGYLIGGEKRKSEKSRLRKGCNVLVATPGRLLDHIKHTTALKLESVRCLVLDEADRMLDMGYERDISEIVAALGNAATNSGYNPMQLLRQQLKPNLNNQSEQGDKKQNEDLAENKTDKKFDMGFKRRISEATTSKNTESNSGYDAMQLLRQRLKTNVNNENKHENKKNNKEDSDEIKNVIVKQDHHSNTDEDSNDDSELKNSKSTSNVDEEKTEKDESSDSKEPHKRQTLLLSATLTHAVEKLAGLTMNDPVFIDAAKDNIEAAGGNLTDINEDLVVPQSVIQSYIVTPPKLRMVTLSAYIAGKCQSHGNHKILIFMATQDMVDYHAEILSSVLSKPADEEDEDSDPLVDVEFFKLHGNMTQKERTEVFKTYKQANSGVLLCTDVAARGLDIPKVDTVVQYTGPTSARDYVHRIGRTARAGTSGAATIFLTPPEIQFVRMLEARKIRIKQDDMDDVLSKLLIPLSKHNTVQAAAIALQNEFENLVLDNKKFYAMACKAYTSWVRFYSSYPREMREVFNRKDLHLGHYAKSFALREPPQKIGSAGKIIREKEEAGQARPKHQNRLSNQREEYKKLESDEKGSSLRQHDRRKNMLKNVRMLNVSEYGSGLEPIKKPKKL